ncbi:Uncharacterised protein [Enterobacter hormaechei]|nr:Uncharacterised protein [Enterobacter hormaechei]
MFTQQVGRLGLLLTEDGDQHIGARHFATSGRLDVENRALQHALEAERRLCVALFFTGWQHRCGLFDEGFEFLT